MSTPLWYVELNRVRAKLAISAEEYQSSRARYPLGRKSAPEMLDLESCQQEWSTATWREALN